ncbi:MAG: ATP-grasp domain-containing protein [Bacteroidales bacterium]|nr:ATP-grasp domain-containing protein [Bacteroidales bacterium]
MKDRIVIIGGDHHNTLGLVRSYGIKGIKADAILIGSTVDGFVLKSKYVGQGFRVQSPKEAVNCLINHYGNFDGIVVVQTSSDEAGAALDDAIENIPSHIKIPNAKGRLSFLMNKDNMCQLAKSVGLIVPQYILVHPAEIMDKVDDGIIYPCITKAISSLDGGKADTTICQSANELVAFLKKDHRCPNVIVEQFIEKEIEFQFFGLSLNGGEEIIIPGHSHIHRPGIQNEYYFPYIENDESFVDTLSKAKDFIRKAKYSGLFSVEFLRGKDGKDYFLEMNFRNDGNAICVTDAGFNLPYIWYLFEAGEDYKKELSSYTFKTVEFCPDVIYFYHMMRGELGFKEWRQTTKRSNSFTTYYKGDNKPFWCNIKANIKGFTLSIIKNILHI